MEPEQPLPVAASDGDLERALQSLELGQLLPRFHAPLGVHRLAEVAELEIEDLAEIGLTRLQIRRLLRVVKAAAAGKPDADRFEAAAARGLAALCHCFCVLCFLSVPFLAGPWDDLRLPASRARDASPRSAARSRRRSSSPCPARRRSASRVTFRSVSSSSGLEFEQRCRSEILEWLRGYGEEVCPKALGIQQHDCDLVVKLSASLPSSQVLPKSFQLVRPGIAHCSKGSLLFFEMKSRARRVDHAVLQLRTRQELLRFRPATPCQVQLFAILALVPSDTSGYQMLRDAAWKHGDVEIATVDPDTLPPEDLQTTLEECSGEDTADALKQDVYEALAHGPVHLVTLASGLGFAKRYNKLFHEGRRVNNGSWTAFLRSIPGVQVEVRETGGYMPHSNVWLTKYPAPGQPRAPSGFGEAPWPRDADWHCWQPYQGHGDGRARAAARASLERVQGG
eukprot:s338_g11.t1